MILKEELSQLVIRQAVEADLPALEWDGEYTHFRRLYADVYNGVIHHNALMWIAELPGTGLVGQLFISLISSRFELADGQTRAYVYGFRVKPDYRSQGVGTAMMEIIEEDLHRRGFSRVTLNVSKENTSARRLYERLGYRVVGNEAGRWSYIDDQGRRQEVHEPAWRMEKLL